MQDRKKFHGNDETGLINVQCSHVYVLVSVDMYLGERYATPFSDDTNFADLMKDMHMWIMRSIEYSDYAIFSTLC